MKANYLGKESHSAFNEILDGRGTIHEIKDAFLKTNPEILRRGQTDEEILNETYLERTRKELRKYKMVFEFEGQTLTVRACYNIQRYRQGVKIREYAMVGKMYLTELVDVIRRYQTTGEAHIAIAGKVKSLIPEQLSLFDLEG